MLRIGKLTDYAMLILGHLAIAPDQVKSTSVLAECLRLPPPTVSKILKMLAEAKLVDSIRGAEGGYNLSKAPSAISVADVIVAMEGGLSLTECCEHAELCGLNTHCSMQESWKKINKKILAMLSNISIVEMNASVSHE